MKNTPPSFCSENPADTTRSIRPDFAGRVVHYLDLDETPKK